MSVGRTILSATLAVSLAACGGGGSNGGNLGGGGSGGGVGTTDCSLGARKSWVLSQMNEWYLFPELFNASAPTSSSQTVQDYIDALVAPARAQDKDRFFSYITSIKEETALINSGSNAGFGVRLNYDTTNNKVFVVEAFETAPAFPKGIDRGTEIVAINGQSVASLMAAGGASAVSSALGPAQAGITRDLTIIPLGGAQTTVSVTKAEYSLDPISDRYGVKIFDNGGTKVGYLNLRTFIIDDAKTQLRNAFAQFKSQGVTQVILDLRYNGGGLVSVAEVLGDLMAADRVGQQFSRTILRESKNSQNSTRNFQAESSAIAATKIAVIGTEATASASELVTNAFIPYLSNNIALVGTDTYGKPVGQFAFDRSACDDRLRAVAFRSVNAAGGGDYYSGLASVMPVTCRATDQFLTPLGDPTEASISVALDFLAGRSCTAILDGSRANTAQQPSFQEGLMGIPREPSAAQVQVPGLF